MAGSNQRHHRRAGVVLLLAVMAAAGAAVAAGAPVTTVSGDVVDARSTGGSSSSRGGSGALSTMSCSAKSIAMQGNLTVAPTWSETAPLTLNFVPLERGQCVGYAIPADALDGSACASKSPDSHILVEFWQLGPNSTAAGGSIGGPGSGRSGLPRVPYDGSSPVIDVRVLAARGTRPAITWGADDVIKVVPPIRDAGTGLTPVGSFQDDAGVVYDRPALRLLFPTDSPVTDVGEPADADTWYVTIANLPDQQALPAYAIRASCVTPNTAAAAPAAGATTAKGRNSSTSSSKAGNGMPCPVPAPGGKQCNGHGSCKVDPTALVPEASRYCACDPGWGSWGCQQPLLSLPLNAPAPLTATIPPGKWGYWEVQLPPARGSAGPLGSEGGGGSEQLLLTAERLPAPGYGGNPLLFLKPFGTKDHNEPALDGLSLDVVSYADLRSFQLQLNRQFINYRLPMRDSGAPARAAGLLGLGSRTASNPRRWYVAVYNSNASRLSEPVRLKLAVSYRDLSRGQAPVCPFDCSGRGRCADPVAAYASRGVAPLGGAAGAPGSSTASRRAAAAAAAAGGSSGASGLNPELAATMALGPLQDQSPLDAGFMCVCASGYGGLLCEGRVRNVTVGSGEQRQGPEVLEPGSWFYYVTNIDSGFNPANSDLGVHWIIGEPSSPPSNYTNAYISFDQGPQHRQQLGGMMGGLERRPPVRRGMTPYSKLLVRSNPPLPLQVPGGQLAPGGAYVVSIFNNDYAVSSPFIFSLTFFVMAESGSFLHPYMSILLGVTAAVVLCLAVTLAKRLVIRYGLWPARWGGAGRASGGPGGPNSLALVLMAQSRGVPPEIYGTFPCRPYAAKEYCKRQQQGGAAAAAAAADAAGQQQQQQAAGRAGGGDGAATAAAEAGDVARGGGGQQQQHDQGRRGMRRAGGAAAAGAATGAADDGDAVAAAANDQQPAPAAGKAPAAAAGALGSPTAAGSPTTDAAAAAAAAALGVSKDDEGPSCSVCLCEYVAGELIRELPCSHEFHQVCIDQWMDSHGTCPICRAALWHGAFEDDGGAGGDEDAAAAAQRRSSGAGAGGPHDAATIYVHHAMVGPGMGGAAGGAATGAAGEQQQQRRRSELLRAFGLWSRREQRLQHHLARPPRMVVTQSLNAAGSGGQQQQQQAPAAAASNWRRWGAQSTPVQQQQQQHEQQQQERDARAASIELGRQQQHAAMQVHFQLLQQQQQQQQQAEAGGGPQQMQPVGTLSYGRRQ